VWGGTQSFNRSSPLRVGVKQYLAYITISEGGGGGGGESVNARNMTPAAATVDTAVPPERETALTAVYGCHLVLLLAVTNGPHSCRKNSHVQSQTAVYYHQIPHLLTTHKHPFSVEYQELGRVIPFGPRQKISEIIKSTRPK